MCRQSKLDVALLFSLSLLSLSLLVVSDCRAEFEWKDQNESAMDTTQGPGDVADETQL